MTTMNAIGAVGFLNMATQLALGGQSGAGTALMGVSALFAVLTLLGLRRVQRLDKFEKQVKGN